MRRYRGRQPFFQGRERTRLFGMIAVLVVLYLAIERSRRPESWAWLTGAEQVEADGNNGGQKALAQAGAEKAEVLAAEEEELAHDDEFPPDEDEEERGALAENLETVIGLDGNLGINKLEMPAYWRLVEWSKRQTPKAMAKRKVEPITFDQFMRQANEHRGKLTKFDLNVRRVVKQPAEEGNPAGVDHVYELIGSTKESGSRLNFCIVPELPEGMPVGWAVDERVTFVGYFLKVQGFINDDLSKQQKSTRKDTGPLFVGRIVRQAQSAPVPEDPEWAWWLLGSVGAVMVLGVVGWAFKPRWRPPSVRSDVDDAEKQQLLDEFLSPRLETQDSASNDGRSQSPGNQ
jgi:hypothetical protein